MTHETDYSGQQPWDVVICGGGMAGLTLARQLRRGQPSLSILVIEKRAAAPRAATHKVGESAVELGSHYLGHTLALASYLERIGGILRQVEG